VPSHSRFARIAAFDRVLRLRQAPVQLPPPSFVPSGAGRAGLSPRHFARLFRSEVGVTPAAWVEAARVAAARRFLEIDQDTPKRVAVQCGFANADTLRRVFVRHVGVTPSEYRKRYAKAQNEKAG